MLLTVLSYLLNAYSHSYAFKYCHLAMKKKKIVQGQVVLHCQEWVFSSTDFGQAVPADASSDYDLPSLFSLRRVRVQGTGHAAYFISVRALAQSACSV